MERYCPRCGYKSSFRFCPECGFKLEDIQIEDQASPPHHQDNLKQLFETDYPAYKRAILEQKKQQSGSGQQTPPASETAGSEADRLLAEILAGMECQTPEPKKNIQTASVFTDGSIQSSISAPKKSVQSDETAAASSRMQQISSDQSVSSYHPAVSSSSYSSQANYSSAYTTQPNAFPYWPVTNVFPQEYYEKTVWLKARFCPMDYLKFHRVVMIISAILSIIVTCLTCYSYFGAIQRSDAQDAVLLKISIGIFILELIYTLIQAFLFYRLHPAGYVMFLIGSIIQFPLILNQSLAIGYTSYDLIVNTISSVLVSAPGTVLLFWYYEKRRFLFMPSADPPKLQLINGKYYRLAATPKIKREILMLCGAYLLVFILSVLFFALNTSDFYL